MFLFYLTLLLGFILIYAFTYFGAIFYVADLLANFPHFFIYAGLILGILGLVHFRKMALVFLAVALFEALKLGSFFLPTKVLAGESIKIVQYNQYYYNRTPDEVFAWLKKGAEGADIIAIDEAEDETINRLHLLREIFPHQSIQASSIGRRSIAVLSKLPVTDQYVYDFKNKEKLWHFYIKLKLKTLAGKDFTFYATHLSSPHSLAMWENRNKQLQKLAEDIKADNSENKILIGDMNVTPNSYWFKNFINDSGLKNSMEGTNIKGSWPNFAPGFTRIVIDHILYSGNLVPKHREVLSARGSDHLPVKVEFVFP